MKKITLIAAVCAAFACTAQAQTATAPAAAAAALPPAQVSDNSMDLEKTMKAMGRHFKAIHQASDILTTGEDVDALLRYISQAEALGLSLPDAKASELTDAQKASYTKGMQQLRSQALELQAAVAAKDADKAKAAAKAMGETRKAGHGEFGV